MISRLTWGRWVNWKYEGRLRLKEKGKKGNKKEPQVHIDIGFGNLFKGIGNFIDLISDMVEKGQEFAEETKEFRGKGALKDLKGVYGFSVKMGIGGQPTVEPFGNIRSTPTGPKVDETTDPIVDLFAEGDEIVVVAEMPGVDEENIHWETQGDILTVWAEGTRRKYRKEVLLPSEVVPEVLSQSHRNGILELRFRKK